MNERLGVGCDVAFFMRARVCAGSSRSDGEAAQEAGDVGWAQVVFEGYSCLE